MLTRIVKIYLWMLIAGFSFCNAMENRKSKALYSFASPVNLSYFPKEQEFIISKNDKHIYIPADTSITIKVFASEQEPYEEVSASDSMQKDQKSGTIATIFGLGFVCGGTCLYMMQKCQQMLLSRK